MLLASTGLVFLTIYTFFSAIRSRQTQEKADLQGRLKNALEWEEPADVREAELSRPFLERLSAPLLQAVSTLASRLLPAIILQSLEKKVQQTGRQGGLSPRNYLGMKLLAVVTVPVVIYLLMGSTWSLKTLGLVAFSAFIAWRLPEMQLDRIIRQRHDQLEKSFPDSMDLLTVSVEAGLGFDGALAKVAEKSEGPVAEEFRRLLHEIRMGKSRKEALRDFGVRCGVEDIILFTSTVIQAEQLGLNISNTLKTQAEQMRRKRRQRVEEKAMKIPVKMLMPMVVFIFPTIFVVLLGPALIQIMENFVR
ncbi:MAG TPA: type II secretion system F family protein [Oscillospiraceae bacterium]|nr:type II secretion system F family protein [Oscillospiraceae bacterium]